MANLDRPETSAEADGPVASGDRAPPHGTRLTAFAVDLGLVLLLASRVDAGWWFVLVVFVAYHTTLLWLTGQTVGKAVANLEVRRVDGIDYVRTSRGLLWVLGRSSIGYLLVDVLGLGLLVAFWRRNTARRCFHDFVFGSQVVLRGELDWALPRVKQRLVEFARTRRHGSQEVQDRQEEARELKGLWGWLVAGALKLDAILATIADTIASAVGLVQRGISWVSQRLGSTHPVEGLSTGMPVKAAVGVGASTSAATVGAVVAASVLVGPAAGLSPVGVWGGGFVEIEATGPETYIGHLLEGFRAWDTGCIYERGDTYLRMRGSGPAYDGEVRWSVSEGGTCTRFEWSDADFELDDSGARDGSAEQVLRFCSTGPLGREQCSEWTRG